MHRFYSFSHLLCSAQENKRFDDAFKAYEQGIALFKYPHVRVIWQTYLAKFIERYSGPGLHGKLERARDLFREAIESVSFCPGSQVRGFQLAGSWGLWL